MFSKINCVTFFCSHFFYFTLAFGVIRYCMLPFIIIKKIIKMSVLCKLRIASHLVACNLYDHPAHRQEGVSKRIVRVCQSLNIMLRHTGWSLFNTLDPRPKGLVLSPSRGHCSVFWGRTLYHHNTSAPSGRKKV